MPVNDYYLVPLVTCTLTDTIVCLDTVLMLFIKHNHCHHHRVLGFFVVIAMLYTLHKYRYWYWVVVLLEANNTGYWILRAFLGIVLTIFYFCTPLMLHS